jgi:hypothetical protein
VFRNARRCESRQVHRPIRVPDALPNAPVAGKLTDCHVHLAALPEGANGCYISPRMLRSPLFRFLIWKHRLDLADPASANRRYVADLLAELAGSRFVGRAILLGMDGVYDSRGEPDLGATEFLISNDYVLRIAAAHGEVFGAGVSINPQRRDAVEEVHRCADAGAALVKVLPNSQQFDPGDRRYLPFYRTLAARRLPLLSHVGYEFSLIGKDQSAGDPARLRPALEEGATVIAAHGCSYGLFFREKFFGTFLELVRRHPNFYADVSALTLPNRCGMLMRLRRHAELHPRLLFGTDYPLAVFQYPCWGRVGFGALRELWRTKNRFDRLVLVCRHLGVDFRSFEEVRALA